MSILISHPTGNTFSRAAAEAFDQTDILGGFQTCIAVGNDSKNPLANKLYAQRRCNIPDHLIHTHPTREALRLLSQKSDFFSGFRRHESGPLSVDRIYRSLDQKVAQFLKGNSSNLAAVYAYEDGALDSFEVARENQLQCIYDLPIGYWRAARRIQSEEAERKPEWAATMRALIDSDSKLERKDMELKLADHIIVASQFTADTLKEAPFELPAPVVIPYGCPPIRTEPLQLARQDAPLKVLYVGELSQRKGISYLLDAVDQLGDMVELTIVGKRVAECAPLDAALKKYKWIDSLPHPQILETMRAHDVLVFPSLFEGFGLVLTEALSQGIPVISTAHTCAPDILTDGQEGFIVPIRDATAIAEKLTLLNGDRPRLQAMKEQAIERAKSITWDLYKSRLSATAKTILDQ